MSTSTESRQRVVGYWIATGLIATASHFAVGDDVRHIVTPLVLAGIAMASWALRPDSRRLAG